MGRGNDGIDRDLLAFVCEVEDDAPLGERKKKAKGPPDVGSRNEGEDSLLTGSLLNATLARDREQVSVGDLTAVLGDDTGFANLRKRIDTIVEASEDPEAALAAGKSDRRRGPNVNIVATPLGTHEAQRLERAVAYDISTREVNKWIPIVRASRSAKHLVFPPKASLAPSSAIECVEGTGAGTPTSLEQRMAEAMQRNGWASEQGLIKEEQLELAKLTPEEVEKRYAELAKKRSLLFFSERKNRHRNKIKSKSYRRSVRREREKRALKEADAEAAHLGEEQLRGERVKAELERIRERMTLKTRKANKWAHDLMHKRKLEAGSREEVMQQVRDKDRLRQEILGKASQLGADDEDDMHSGLDDAGDEEHFVDEEDASSSDGEEQRPAGSLGGRKRRALASRDDCSDNDNNDDDDGDNQTTSNEVDEIFAQAKRGRGKTGGRDAGCQDEEKPVVVGRRVFSPENPLNHREADSPLATLEEAMPMTVAKKKGGRKSPAARPNIGDLLKADDDNDNVDGQEEGGSQAADGDVGSNQTRAQLELIKRAFDGDAVFAQFNEEKRAEVEEDRPKDVDLTLPGWGSWGGEGIAPPKGKVIIKGTGGVDPSQRKDAHLRHVIIHEKRAKKVARLMVEKPPFPYRSRDDYEQSLNRPVGKEWNSTMAFCQKIKPRIQVRTGHVIEPASYVKPGTSA